MLVKRYRQYNRDRAQEKRNVVAAYFVRLVTRARDAQESDDENVCNQERVHERVTPLFVKRDANFKSDKRKKNTEEGHGV